MIDVMKKILVVLMSAIACAETAWTAVVINEVQSSNDATCIDENGESSDWIELYNNGAEAVDLSGWGLSDNTSKLFKWTFPEGTTIAAGGYLRVFADSVKTKTTSEMAALRPDDETLNEDLVTWMDADTALATYGEGGSVASWQDKSSYCNNATNATVSCQPKVYGNVINGHAALRFVQTSRTELDFNHLDFNGMTSMSNFTVFVMARWSGEKPRSSGLGLFGLSRTSMTTNNIIFQVYDFPSYMLRLYCGNNKQYCNGTAVYGNAWANLACSLDSEREIPRMSIYKDNDRVAIGDTTVVMESMAEFSRMMIGRGYVGDTRFFDGDIAEFILFRRELTDVEYKSVYAYLEEKYALSHVNNLHTSFSLSSEGETLCLTPFGALEPVDSVSFGTIPCDTSYGRTPEGWGYFSEPTPGEANAATSYAEPLAQVCFSRERGICSEPFELELTHPDAEVKIYYTIDHRDPSEENGILYTEPIRIAGTTIVRATAVKAGALPYRNIAANTYIYLEDILKQEKPEIAPEVWADKESTPASYGLSPNVVFDEETFSQFKESLLRVPIVSITMSDEDMFNPADGLYTKPKTLKGQEKAASVEWVTGENVFGLEAGVRIQGNTSPSFKYTPKKSFRLCFRGRYGASSLDRPVLSDVGCKTADFNTLILRAENGCSWPGFNMPQCGTSMRDQFIRNLQGEISGYQSEGTHVGVFINGMYWGLYNLCERIDSDFAALKFGGDERNYTVFAANGTSATQTRDGNSIPYKTWSNKIATTDMSVKENYLEAIENLDIVNFVDYMLIKNFVVDQDWPYNNWTVTYSKEDGTPCRFFVWDSESTLRSETYDRFAQPSQPNLFGPQVLHLSLTNSTEYCLLFADRVQKQFMTAGAPLSLDGFPKRYATMAAQVRPRVFAESARWGAYRHDAGLGTAVYGLADWDKECNRITNNFAKARNKTFMMQLKKYGLYPNVNAVTLSPSEGGAVVSMSADAGTIYYTVDGSDPRVAFEGIVSPTAQEYTGEPITSEADATIKARVLSAEGEWSALTEMPIVGSSPTVTRNEFLMSTNGENWDKDANWSEGYFPNEAGATAVIGVPTEFKKDKGWRNIHINKTNVTVGHLEVTSGGCTNRIDTGKSGDLTFSEKLDAEGVATEAASIVIRDEANPSLLMIDLDAPNKVVLATDLEVVVSNAVGDVEYGGALFKGIWEGNGHNLAKSGVGRLTLDVANTAETAFGKIQVAEGSVDITKKIYAEAITKEGVCSAKLGGSELEAAVATASELADKVSVNNVRLFIPSYLGGATYYGAFVATSLTTANAKKGKTVSVYIRDLSGDVHFDGKTYRRLADATIGTQTLEDGRVTYKVSVPQQDVRAEISSMAQGEGLAIGMETLPGQKYTLQYRELLDSGGWEDVMTLEGDGQFHEFTVEKSGSSGFYRVVVGD